jgi:hypothetical protein
MKIFACIELMFIAVLPITHFENAEVAIHRVLGAWHPDEFANTAHRTLMSIARTKIIEADNEIQRAERLLEDGKYTDAQSALKNAISVQSKALHGLKLIENLPARLHFYYYSKIEDLSVLKIRVLKARPKNSESNNSDVDIRVRIFIKIADFILKGNYFQDINAEIIDITNVGKRYASETRKGKEFPNDLRQDLSKGEILDLENDAPQTGVDQLVEGREYYIAITPPIASKGIPRAEGAMGRTRIVFAIQAEQKDKQMPRRQRF